MYKVITVFILALCGAYILSVKNVSLNITNSFIPDLFRRPVVITQVKHEPTPVKVFATHSGAYDRKGKLKITSKKQITLYLVEDSSRKKIGPFKIKAQHELNIEIEKGNYKAFVQEGNDKYVTDLRFLGNTGTLEL